MTKLSISILLLASTSLMFFYFYKKEKALTCKSELSVINNKDRLNVVSILSLKSGKGVLTLSGVLYNGSQVVGHISRNIGFTYIKRGKNYAFKSLVVVNSPQMALSPRDEEKWFPAFFRRENQTAFFKVRPLGDNQWLIYHAVVPQYLCEKVP